MDSGDEHSQDFVAVDLPRILDGSSRSAEVGRGLSVPVKVSSCKGVYFKATPHAVGCVGVNVLHVENSG